MNLLINAAQAMGGHGQIVVTLTKSGNFATIEVRDTGPGISPEIRPPDERRNFTVDRSCSIALIAAALSSR